MALVNTEQLASQFSGFSHLPALKQVALMIGLAASVALGVGVVLWSQQPNYSLLYASMSSTDAINVLEALDKFAIPYRMEHGSGAITVPSAQVHEARLKLATLGLPKSDVTGLEFLDREQSLGTSRMIETARYHRALAGELSRSIATLESVESARVHLAIPKQSVFIRKHNKASASVLVNLYPGRELNDTRVAGIVHLVASSIPGLDAEQVTVVDQKGRLLTEKDTVGELAGRNSRLKYTQQVEQSYVKRILDILAPITGEDKVRAQVTADIDFTRTEQTSEIFKPDTPAIRSEQLDERLSGGPEPYGVPGALSNQPPPAGTTEGELEAQTGQPPVTTSKRSTRNYELDRTLSHSRNTPGRVQRLSVAVVVDYRLQPDGTGGFEQIPLSPEEMDYITTLVKEAVGYSKARGDSVNVVNASFVKTDEPEPLPEPKVWEQPWVMDMAKQLLGALLVVILLLGVLRPVMKGLAQVNRGKREQAQLGVGDGQQLPGQEDQLSLSHKAGAHAQIGGMSEAQNYSSALEEVKTLVNEDPARVSQVVKGWLGAEDQSG